MIVSQQKRITLSLIVFILGLQSCAPSGRVIILSRYEEEGIQYSRLRGTVTDLRTADPIVGAPVTLESILNPKGAVIRTFTNYDGHFAIAKITPGEYSVVVSYMGMDTVRLRSLILRPGETVTVRCELAEIQLRFPEVE